MPSRSCGSNPCGSLSTKCSQAWANTIIKWQLRFGLSLIGWEKNQTQLSSITGSAPGELQCLGTSSVVQLHCTTNHPTRLGTGRREFPLRISKSTCYLSKPLKKQKQKQSKRKTNLHQLGKSCLGMAVVKHAALFGLVTANPN